MSEGFYPILFSVWRTRDCQRPPHCHQLHHSASKTIQFTRKTKFHAFRAVVSGWNNAQLSFLKWTVALLQNEMTRQGGRRFYDCVVCPPLWTMVTGFLAQFCGWALKNIDLCLCAGYEFSNPIFLLIRTLKARLRWSVDLICWIQFHI